MHQSRRHRLIEWWRPKAGTIFSLLLFYLALWQVGFVEGGKLLFFSAVTLLGFGFLGYLLNDLADIADDEKAGKTNVVAGIPKLLRPFAFLFVLALALFPWMVCFEVDKITVALIVAQITLQVIYPLPPIRLKRFSIAAAITDAMYAFVVPAVLALHTFEITSSTIHTQDGLHLVFVVVWMLAMGVRHILNHHVADRFNDKKTNTPNLANDKPPHQLRRFIEITVFPLEVVGSFGFFASLIRYSDTKPVLPLVLIGIAAMGHWVTRLPFFRVGFSETRMDSFAKMQLAAFSLVLLAWNDVKYVAVGALFIVLFTDVSTHPLTRFLLVQIKKLVVGLVRSSVSMPSLWFNWALYYFRKWFLGWSEERNWGEHYQKRLEDLHLDKRGNVAIFNWNYQKFSETYVHQQRKALDYRVDYYFGVPKPMFHHGSGHLVQTNEYVRQTKYAALRFLNVDIDNYETRIIASKLLERNTQIIVAHFGTMGSVLTKVSEQTGIPMVVVYHGYDAWNQSQLKANQREYQELFKVAAAVVGVSKDICSRLQQLGCHKDKIHYLPAYFDLEQFPFVQRPEPKVVTFLSVGRFSKTKAPLLLLTAFAEVLKQVANVKLVMIGGDDGEGLFEPAIMQAKALGISHKVEFKGIMNGEGVREQMEQASVFVQHSVTTPLEGDKEGTPISVMEAMATGLPVLATQHAGIAEVIESQVSGILVDEYDINAMVEKMVLLAGDTGLRNQLGNSAAERIRKNEYVVKNVSKLSAILDNHKLAK